MAQTTSLEELAPVIEETAQPASLAMTESVFESHSHEEFAALESRLASAEATIARLASLAHTEHTMELGAPEIAAIGAALKGQITQHIHDVLKKHFNFTPPAIRGDGS